MFIHLYYRLKWQHIQALQLFVEIFVVKKRGLALFARQLDEVRLFNFGFTLR